MECQYSPEAINMYNMNDVVIDKSDQQSEKTENTMIKIADNCSKQASPFVTDTRKNDNESLSTTITIKNNNVRGSLMNHSNRYENKDINDRSSPINGPGLAKPISLPSSNSLGTKNIDAALEKNLATMTTQVRRTTSAKTSELTPNDLQLFDSTTSVSTVNSYQSREMTPDSINDESIQNAYNQQQQYPPYQHSMIPPPTVDQYGQTLWSPGVYAFPHQHPGLYLPYPTVPNGISPFYHPTLMEQNYSPQTLSSFYAQQQVMAARILHEHAAMSDNLLSQLTTPTKPQSENSLSISGESLKSPDLITNRNENKNLPINKSLRLIDQSFSTIHDNLSRLSPEFLSEGANDADSVISMDSIKSNPTISLPILEDGLSDSENTSDKEESQPQVKRSNNSHQSTQIDLIPASNKSHEIQFSKSNNNKNMKSQSTTSSSHSNQPKIILEESSTIHTDYDTDEETDKLLSLEHRAHERNQTIRDAAVSKGNKSRSREVYKRVVADPENPSVLIEGILFRCRYLGSTQLPVEGNPTKLSRMMQAQEAVERIKAPYGESQPSVEIDLFVSAEKIMVLNTDLEDILMDHSLRSIAYIADIGDLVILMAKRRYIQNEHNENGTNDLNGISTRRVVSINQKLICHVFESEEAQSIAHAIGEAFQVAYIEYLRANGIDDPNLTRDIDYQDVLDQQELYTEELERFSRKECQKEAIVTKAKNEPVGIVIVESGWGSMLPTVVIANMMPGGPAARGGQLNIGDQIISVNGISMVGLPLSTCQSQIKNMKHLTTVRFVVIPCPPVVDVLIRRPDTKYQLGFSVQNGIICSLLRGGIAERGGVRVGHRIIEINGQSVVATSHEKIVHMLSNSIGELRMKTMPTQVYRLLTGQENPIYI